MALSRRRFLELAAATGAAASMPAWPAWPREQGPVQGEWLAGDFHCHTVLSHDVWGGPADDNTDIQDFYTFGWTAGEQIRQAESRGLDFLAITDHNRVEALLDPEYSSSQLVLVPGYEHSLERGHAGVFVPSVSLLSEIITDRDGSTSFDGDAGLKRFFASVRERKGITVLNHPFYGNQEDGEDISWGYGVLASLGFHALEVWNISWPARHDVLPFADADNYLSLAWWEKEFVARKRMPAVGGSDNHWRSTAALQGVGQPTTWVLATDRTPQAIIDAVRAGRTTISAEPSLLLGPRLTMTATEAWAGGRTATIGGTVRAEGDLALFVEVENGLGHRLRIVVSGESIVDEPMTSASVAYETSVALPQGGWVRAERYLDRGYWMGALTSPIYAAGLAPLRARAEPSRGPAVTSGHPRARSPYLPLKGR